MVAMHLTQQIDKLFKKTLSNTPYYRTAASLQFPFREYLKSLPHALYQPYKWLIFVPFFGLSTIIGSLSTLISTLLFGPRISSAIIPPLWARLNSWMIPMFVKTIGKELIDPKQSYVVVSNHQSLFDIFVIYGWLGIDFKWVMKKELRKAPFIGYACYKLEHIYIDRANRDDAVESINQAKKRIVNGVSVMFFPEGTRSADGKLGTFKKGAFRLAVDLGVPVLPVTISGTRKILPKSSLDLFPGKIKMIVHPPIQTQGHTHEALGPLMNMTREKIKSALPCN
jgi:1-acyl-sn-glycerol-3-phosphate acyltransferase